MLILFLIVVATIALIVWSKNRSADRPTAIHDSLPAPMDNGRVTPQSDQNRENGGDHDAWEGSFWEVKEPFAVQARLRFRYSDSVGSRTERTVDVRQMGNDGYGNLLIGHCQLRNATRTFRPDRITDCVDLETGEVVNDVYAYLRQKYDSSPEHSRDRLFQDEYDSLRVLLYVGKADGQLRRPERAVIRDTCRTLAKDARISDDLVDELVSQLEIPSPHAFKLAVGRLARRSEEDRNLLFTAAANMVSTQKVVDPSEQQLLDYLKKRFAL